MSLRDLPAVEHLLQTEAATGLIADFGRPLTVTAIRNRLEHARQAIKDGEQAPDSERLLLDSREMLKDWLTPTLRPVINATGVILHTNLGRAPLSLEAQMAMRAVSSGYSTLEYNLGTGKRGKRETHTERLLCRLTGAHAALVVNNNAAAVLLALTALARRKEVLVSRSQLIEIGGGFRVPDIMKQSGAKLVEVGTTNRTHLKDFESAINQRTSLILRAHHSNFRIIGFTAEPSLQELVELGAQRGIPVVDDLGSGALLNTETFGLGHESTVHESLSAGASVVAFSGDKLLGGPQAGILLGEKTLIDRLRKHPLARAVRPDKLCLAALSETLIHYLKDEAVVKIPVWRMIAAPEDALRNRAKAWVQQLGQGEVLAGNATVGGGSLPEETLPTWLLALSVRHPKAVAKRLRAGEPPVIARIEAGRLIVDPRTVLPEQDELLLDALHVALKVKARVGKYKPPGSNSS